MSLKFWLGGAKSDKSDKLTQYVLSEAAANPSRQYLVVVPEQICLKTQKEYVAKSANHGILNIDILPFSRLAHRITDEVGDSRANVTTLDDMGKSLLIEHIANIHKDELTVIGENIGKLGYIEKVKSAISEFMQYGISVEKAYELAAKSESQGHGFLASKLKDVAFLYDCFSQTIKDRYTTVEETLDRTADIVHNSDTIKNSVIVFDGFTGFTPVQVKLIGRMMEYAVDIHVALLLEESGANRKDENGNANRLVEDKSARINNTIKEHELFYLSKRTINQLERMADERHVRIEDPYKYNTFSATTKSVPSVDNFSQTNCPGEKRCITPAILIGQNPDEEIEMVCGQIRRLVRGNGYRYKDIAIITGDIEKYRRTVGRVLGGHGIPYFIDKSEPVLMNPFTEYIRSIISVYVDNFSPASVFRFLKSGIVEFDSEEICILENYCIATGVKGYKKWHSRFVEITRTFDADNAIAIDKIREQVISKIDSFAGYLNEGNANTRLMPADKHEVRDFAAAIYRFIDADDMEQKLKESAKRFEAEGNFEKKEEYSQVYVRFMNILDQLCELIPDEKINIKEFGELIDAALSEVRIGILPGRIDYVQIGDLTRSRLDAPKALFIVGANDGIIPSVSGKSGIINDADKEFLLKQDEELMLAPTVREDEYTQRLYLYMMMNAPTEKLFVSYAGISSDGKALTPSYIIRKLKQQNPGIEVLHARDNEDYRDAYLDIANNLYSVICGEADSSTTDRILNLLRVILSGNDHEQIRSKLYDILNYALLTSGSEINGILGVGVSENGISENGVSENGDSIGKALANALYGRKIVGSVTRLETYANCAYQYFLKYGLKLNERETFEFEANEMGSIFHGSLSEFASLMDEEGISWPDISEEDEKRLVDRAVEKSVASEHMAKLYTTARSTYMVSRIKRIMGRTVNVLKAQLEHGEFKPKHFEVDFDTLGDLNCLNIRLSDEEMMRLKGRIDRVDTASTDEGTFVKIIDYKSSGKSMNLLAVYEGRQLQLLTYLNAAMEAERMPARESSNVKYPATESSNVKYPATESSNMLASDTDSVIPAGILYYHIDDPYISDAGESDEEIRQSIMKKLRMKGLINSDGKIAELIDRDLAKGSEVLYVTRKKDGDFSASKQLVSGNDFDILSRYVNLKIKDIGQEILSGNICIPVKDGKKRITECDCKYCDYKAVCTNKTGRNVVWDDTDDNSYDGDEIIDAKSVSNDEIIQMMKKALDNAR